MSAVDIGNWLVLLTAALAWAFAVAYHLSAPWWRSAAGWNLMGMAVSIATVTSLSVVRWVAGASLDVGWFAWLRVVVFAQVPVVVAWRIVILWQVQIRPQLPIWRLRLRKAARRMPSWRRE